MQTPRAEESHFDELAASQACFAREFSETKSAQLIKLLHENGDRGASNCWNSISSLRIL